ncbi:MAG: hypothetical protein HY859_15650 [Caulobacterales bacterium]|nr:hypothetical protein [Caulobacterales bacterium]
MKTLTRMLTAAGAAMVLFTAAEPARAYPDQAAGVDANIRPNFGGLITPPVRPRWRPDRYHPRGYRPYRPGKGGYYPPQRAEMSISVDCDAPVQYDNYGPPQGGSYDSGQGGQGGGYGAPPADNGQYNGGNTGGDASGSQYYTPSPIADALSRLADGGTLYVRGTCRETIWIEHPVTIAGQGHSIFDEVTAATATIAPPEGASCIKVAPGTQGVELRDLVLSTDKGGRAACVETWDSKVALVRTTVRYWGDSAAVFASGGMLILQESFIDARTWDAAVVADGAVLRMTRTRVLSEETGVDITPGVGDSLIDQSGILGRDAALPAGNGIMVRGQRSGSGALKVNNAVICGWRNGIHLDRGSIVAVTRSRLCRNTVGVVSDGDLTLVESAINGREVGVYAATGRATIKRNRFYGWTARPIWLENGVVVDFEPNYAYYNDDCWKRSGWEDGIYCQRTSGLPASIRDESQFTNPYRDWWEADGYDRGYARDGAPTAQPYPVRPECIPPLVKVKGKCRTPKPPRR